MSNNFNEQSDQRLINWKAIPTGAEKLNPKIPAFISNDLQVAVSQFAT